LNYFFNTVLCVAEETGVSVTCRHAAAMSSGAYHCSKARVVTAICVSWIFGVANTVPTLLGRKSTIAAFFCQRQVCMNVLVSCFNRLRTSNVVCAFLITVQKLYLKITLFKTKSKDDVDLR